MAHSLLLPITPVSRPLVAVVVASGMEVVAAAGFPTMMIGIGFDAGVVPAMGGGTETVQESEILTVIGYWIANGTEIESGTEIGTGTVT